MHRLTPVAANEPLGLQPRKESLDRRVLRLNVLRIKDFREFTDRRRPALPEHLQHSQLGIRYVFRRTNHGALARVGHSVPSFWDNLSQLSRGALQILAPLHNSWVEWESVGSSRMRFQGMAGQMNGF